MSTKSLVVSRQELKYPINFAQYISLSQILKNVLVEDQHNGKEGYWVRSLYFDSYADADFYEKLNGIENRKKIRLRIYNYNDPKVKLEIKRKYGNNQEKKSIIITREDAKELTCCNYEVLRKYSTKEAVMIYNIMKVNRVRPVVMIEYRRKAFIHPMNNIRMTLDSEIRSSETYFDFFSPSPILAPVEDYYNALLEIKYNNFIFKWLSELIEPHTLTRESYSKYTASRGIFEKYLA